MKLHPDFSFRKIGESAILVPFGKKQINFNGMLTLNKTGAFIAELLQNGEISRTDLIRKITERFEIDEETAAADTDQFLAELRKHSVLESCS